MRCEPTDDLSSVSSTPPYNGRYTVIEQQSQVVCRLDPKGSVLLSFDEGKTFHVPKVIDMERLKRYTRVVLEVDGLSERRLYHYSVWDVPTHAQYKVLNGLIGELWKQSQHHQYVLEHDKRLVANASSE